MKIKLFGMRCRLELAILLLMIGLYVGGTMLCSCMRYEGMQNLNHSSRANENVPYLFKKLDKSCCPSVYSTRSGCPCFDKEELEYLNKRGGNRTGPSLY
tara:strand:- start:193 stop:489 length:297 start_codon:yes stop_codon:yes gene_type:complete